MLSLCVRFPIAKKTWWMYSLERNINLDTIMDTAKNNISEYIDTMMEMRARHPRPFRRKPKYLKFFIMKIGNPRKSKNKKIGEFDIYLDTLKVEVVKPWWD